MAPPNDSPGIQALRRAVRVAAAAHRGQTDKAGEPYIHHPLAVMSRLSGDDERVVAVLHDTLEDTSLTAEKLLSMGFSASVVAALQAMTHKDHEPYLKYVRRICGNKLAVRPKIADVKENLREDRLHDEATKAWHAQRKPKYLEALRMLSEAAEAYGLQVPGDPLPENLALVDEFKAAISAWESGDHQPRKAPAPKA